MLPHVLISTTIPILTNKQLRMMLCVRSGEIPLESICHLFPLFPFSSRYVPQPLITSYSKTSRGLPDHLQKILNETDLCSRLFVAHLFLEHTLWSLRFLLPYVLLPPVTATGEHLADPVLGLGVHGLGYWLCPFQFWSHFLSTKVDIEQMKVQMFYKFF